MHKYFGYIRVSTVKQGEHGVSLQEQRAAIERYALRNNLEVAEWFEERETAAKQGRPVFTRMINLLRSGAVAGVIIHKVDRSARNYRDWARIADLVEGGIDVHFANEGIDLHTRGGRLSADIQAVVAVDYIRNLREEVRKGFYGRIHQGLYPLPAPIGYLDRGRGKAKAIDPVKGPLIRSAFERYAAGFHTLRTLTAELHHEGLRNNRGGVVTKTGISNILNNPFYTGLIRLRRTSEVFEGVHEPLIPPALFRAVQDALLGKTQRRVVRHEFLFRRLLRCSSCSRAVVGEMQKRHVYYRCQNPTCRGTCIREEFIDAAVRTQLARLSLNADESAFLQQQVQDSRAGGQARRVSVTEAVTLRLTQVEARLRKLVDAFLDGALDREIFEERKAGLLAERLALRAQAVALKEGGSDPMDDVDRILELSNLALLSYETADAPRKRRIVQELTSNRTLHQKNVVVELIPPLLIIAERVSVPTGEPIRDRHRTLRMVFEKLVEVCEHGNSYALPFSLDARAA